MNILELSAYFYPNNGGIETVIKNLSTLWSKKEHNVTVITSNQGSTKSYDCLGGIKGRIKSGIKIYYLKSFIVMRDVIIPSLSKKIRQIHKKNKFDIALIHHPHAFLLFTAAYACKKNKIPYCVHMHGRELILPGWRKILTTIYNTIFLKYTLKHAEKIFICVDKIRHQSKILRKNKYKNKLITIPHGINLNKLNINDLKSKSQLKTQLNLKQKHMKQKNMKQKNIILYLGVLRDYKGIDILIKAMPKIIKHVPNTKLIIAGKGPELKKLKNLSNNLKINKHILFQGFVPDKIKPDYYKSADLFVLPSPTIMESFGIVALEAMLTKTPVIVSQGAGIAEVFEKNNIPTVVKPFSSESIANMTIKLLKNKKLSKNIANKSYNLIKNKFQWKHIAKQYLEVFKDVIDNE